MGPNEKPSVSSVKREEFVIHDPEDIANTFNEFFASVASKYRSSSDGNADLKALKKFVQAKMPSCSTFEIPQISESFVMPYLSSIQPNKATGLDSLSACLLKMAAPAIAKPLAKISVEEIKTTLEGDLAVISK